MQTPTPNESIPRLNPILKIFRNQRFRNIVIIILNTIGSIFISTSILSIFLIVKILFFTKYEGWSGLGGAAAAQFLMSFVILSLIFSVLIFLFTRVIIKTNAKYGLLKFWMSPIISLFFIEIISYGILSEISRPKPSSSNRIHSDNNQLKKNDANVSEAESKIENINLKNCPSGKGIANCEIRGKITYFDNNAPTENVMVIAAYDVNKNMSGGKCSECVGPFITTQDGEFTIPPFCMDKTFFANYKDTGITGIIIIIHPTLGAFSVCISKDEFPPDAPFRILELVQHRNGESCINGDITGSYEKEIAHLPLKYRQIAWKHVDVMYRHIQ